MEVAILLYEGVTALDSVGPYEVLHLMPDTEVKFVATEKGLVRTDFGMLSLSADYSLDEVTRPDILLVPGAPDPRAVAADSSVLDWVRNAHENTRWTTSVCTGALILGAAGLLQGIDATTHWMAHAALQDFGARPTLERVVRDGKIITAAGVSAGIDMALRLAALEFGDELAQEIQLIIEYDPQPPFQAGSPATAPAGIRERVLSKYELPL